MKDFLRDLDPTAYSVWVMMTVLYSDSELTCVSLSHFFLFVVFSCVMQEKEQELINVCKGGDLDEAKCLVASGVSVKCRDQVCV